MSNRSVITQEDRVAYNKSIAASKPASKPASYKNIAASKPVYKNIEAEEEVDSQEEEDDVFTWIFAAEDSSDEEEVRTDRFLDPQTRDAWNARYGSYFGKITTKPAAEEGPRFRVGHFEDTTAKISKKPRQKHDAEVGPRFRVGHCEDTTNIPKRPRLKLAVEEEEPHSRVETKPSGKMLGFPKMVAEANPEEAQFDFAKMVAEDSEEELGPDHIYAAQASCFRDEWNALYSRLFGHFEDTTRIPNMRFTYKKPKPHECPAPTTTLQIFSLKVAKIWGGLQWPLRVFGKVAVRDVVDHNRNMIFDRPRESCQFLTQEHPYLKLTGPTRAVVLVDPVVFEVDLQVKGATEDEDQSLSFLAVTYNDFTSLWSRHVTMDYASKLSKVEFELGSVVMSVEATISFRVRGGRWPSGLCAQFSARAASSGFFAHAASARCSARMGRAEVILHDWDQVRVSCNGTISLSRCVVSVEILGKLEVYVRTEQMEVVKKSFKPQKDGASHRVLHLGVCTLDVTVAWSLVSTSL